MKSGLLFILFISLILLISGCAAVKGETFDIQFHRILLIFAACLLLALITVVSLWKKNQRFRQDLERKTITLSTIFTAIPDILYSKDINNKYTSCNLSFQKFAGLKEEEIIGKNALEVFSRSPYEQERHEMAMRFTEMDEKVFRENAIQKVEHCYIFPDGTCRLFECLKAPLIQNGELIGIMGISRDITEHRAVVKAAQAASKTKSAFLTQMSHDILTPMNVISGMTELILREEVSPSVYAKFQSIRHASGNLLSLINDILDFSKIDAGNLEIVEDKYSFASLINDVLVIIRMRLREHQILFTANIDCNIPIWLVGDEARVRQILLNILGNAVKFTNKGFISLTIDAKFEEDSVILTTKISDSGAGIKKEDMGKLFNNFTRLDCVQNKNNSGTGLGLAISKNLCIAMGGDISVQSEYEVGSTFAITMPQRFITPNEKLAQVLNPEAKQVLVYETRPVYADSFARTLDNLGVRHAVTGNWTEFYKELKHFNYPFVFVPSALAENAMQIIEALSLNTKLVLLVELGEALNTLTVCNASSIALPAYAASIANILNDVENNIFYDESCQENVYFIAPTASVLVVDDLNTNLKVAEGLLQPYQMRIDVSKSGEDAIKRIRENYYDIIFMDQMMPGMDGMETTKLIRSMEGRGGYYKSVPIIALTANTVSGMKDTFLQCGMDDILTKPIDIAKLDSLLKKWVPKDKKQKGRNTEHGSTNKECEKLHIEGVDVKTGIAMTGGNFENYLKTLAVFYMDGLDKIKTLQDSVEEDNIKLYTTNVHALKSAAASLGAKEISDFAKALELAGINGDSEFIRKNSQRFLDGLEKLLENINTVITKKREEPQSQYNAGALKTMLIKLKSALRSRDAGEVTDLMSVFAETNWIKNDDGIISEISKNIYLFNYEDAIILIDSLLMKLV